MSERKGAVPHWDLSNVYSGLEADDYRADVGKFAQTLDALEGLIEKHGIGRLEAAPSDLPATGRALDQFIDRLNEALILRSTLNAYLESFVTTDSYNTLAARKMSEFEQLVLRLRSVFVRFEAWIGSLAPSLDAITKTAPRAREHRLALNDIADQSRYRMEPALEDLASELLMAGGGVMHKLQGTVTSQLKVPFERDGKTESLPITVIRNLSNDPDEDVRKRAYEAELKGWESVRESVAFAMNCVKGSSIVLAKRRGLESVLDSVLVSNKIDRETLDALLGAMKDSFPMFRRYFRSKAEKLGKEKLAWWDLSAPIGKVDLTYSWDEASATIVSQFGRFSDEMSNLARRAFERNWIDAEPRDGKRAGAFCMRVPKVDESRILANFDGSFDQLTTLAHELGHAFHNYCQVGLPLLRAGSPMPVAETASIFCETIVFNAALESAPADARLGILENQLIGASQVIVDIYSRFLFESEVVARREKAELSADDFCEIMVRAQKETYGDALDERTLNPYMWLWKPHYYSHGYNFYNFPYAFGLLFSLGVYAIYLKEGKAFIPRYKELLRSTGEGKVADLAARYGIDVRSRRFWDESLAVIEKQVAQYCELS